MRRRQHRLKAFLDGPVYRQQACALLKVADEMIARLEVNKEAGLSCY